jgi:autotransporter-associated beta strand protein
VLEERAVPAALVWSGLGKDNLWSDAANWIAKAAPQAGDSLTFPAGARQPSNVNDLADGFALKALSFSGGGYLITSSQGQALALAALNDRAASGGNILAVNITVTGTPEPVYVLAAAETLDLEGALEGRADLAKLGAGNLLLKGDNSAWGGRLLVSQGTVTVGGVLALGAGAQGPVGGPASAPVTVVAGATLALDGDFQVSRPLLLGGTLLEQNGHGGWLGSVLLTGPHAAVSVAAGAQLDLSGAIDGDYALVKVGPGEVDLLGSNSYTGLSIFQGTVFVTDPASLGSDGPETATIVRGVLELEGQSDDYNQTLTLLGGTLRQLAGANAWDGPINLGTASTFDVQAGELDLFGPVSGGAGPTGQALVKTGEGKLTLPKANDYSGQTVVQEGVLSVQDVQALGATDAAHVSAVSVAEGGTLELNTSVPSTFSYPLFLAGSGSDGQGALDNVGGNNAWAVANIALTAPAAINVEGATHLAIGSGFVNGRATTSGRLISATAGAGLTKQGAGLLSLANDNAAYTGPTIVVQGTLVVQKSRGLGDASQGTTLFGGTLEVDAASGTVAEPLTLQDGTTLTLNGARLGGPIFLEGTATVNTPIRVLSATISGTIRGLPGAGLNKTGDGTLVLSGTGFYTGLTLVLAGTVDLAGQGALPLSTIHVAGGNPTGQGPSPALVLGPRPVGKNFVSVGGIVADPGSAVLANGVQWSGSVNLQGSFTANVVSAEIAPAEGSYRGTVTLSGPLTVLIAVPIIRRGDKFTLIEVPFGSTIIGTFAGLPEGATVSASGHNFTISYVGGAGQDVVLTAQ